ncbi:MAG: hypothetical protein NC094_09460 [Bacteroidales bacterium]|nr:hypothetical protein [Lachnoclostridium sp.]MCM1384923.1 hypothetical protein [Lachnoclostridium sp.]MCM1465633.1 hypothetical protein [Bacteroidales bacterium]
MEQLQKYCLKECHINGISTYITSPKEYDNLLKDKNLLNDLHISKRHIETLFNELKEAHDINLYLAFVYNPNFAEKYRWFPLLCYKSENTFYHVTYRNTWMCRECNHKYNVPIVMPMVEADAIIYQGIEYPKIADVFKKVNCPNCGRPLQNHLIILKDDTESK